MNQLAALRAECLELAEALSDPEHLPDVRAAYLTLMTLLGQVSGQIGAAGRRTPSSDAQRAATTVLDEARAVARQVGLDIRLASQPALAYGIATAAYGMVRALDMLGAGEEGGG